MRQKIVLANWTSSVPGFWENVVSVVTRIVVVLAIILLVLAPIQAILWSRIPFPGFLVEPTLVVGDVGDPSWSGHAAGINGPQLVVAFDGKMVDNREEYLALLSSQTHVGEAVPIVTELPDHSRSIYPQVLLIRLTSKDLLIYFWLPYLVGVVYLATGLWVARQARGALPARAFIYLCANLAIVIAMLFSIYFSIFTSYVWTLAMAEIGATLIAVGLLFPEEISTTQRVTWLRMLAHGIGLGLGIWGILALNNPSNPWAYFRPWRFSYIYAALGTLFFFGTMIYRQFSHLSRVTKQQARILLFGSLFAFVPVAIWLSAPMFGMSLRWNPVLFLPFLLSFPIMFAFAILYYHLWDIDLIIHRTLVYGVLSCTLLIIYFLTVLILLFVSRSISGMDRPGLVTVISTLTIAALFSPLRRRIQNNIDRRFYRQKYDAAITMEKFGDSLRNEVDLESVCSLVLSVVQETLQPEQASLWLLKGANRRKSK